MHEPEKSDPFDVATGARKLAIDTVLRALVDHASQTDPGIRERILNTVNAYTSRLTPRTELEDDFAERAMRFAAAFVRPPEE